MPREKAPAGRCATSVRPASASSTSARAPGAETFWIRAAKISHRVLLRAISGGLAAFIKSKHEARGYTDNEPRSTFL